MNRYKLMSAGVDCNEGIRRFRGNKEAYEDVLVMLLDDDHYKSMVDAMAQNDVKRAFAAAHALKGMAANLSLHKVYDNIFPLTECLREEDMDGATALLPALQESYAQALQAVKLYAGNDRGSEE